MDGGGDYWCRTTEGMATRDCAWCVPAWWTTEQRASPDWLQVHVLRCSRCNFIVYIRARRGRAGAVLLYVRGRLRLFHMQVVQ